MRILRFSYVAMVSQTCLLFSMLLISAYAQNPKPAVSKTSSPLFESKIRPLLLASCVSCHGKDNPQGGLRLDVAVSPEKAQELLRRVRGEGGKPRMPLGTPLPHDKIAALEQWVKEGAIWGIGSTLTSPSLMEKGKSHWAFQPLVRPAVPVISHNLVKSTGHLSSAAKNTTSLSNSLNSSRRTQQPIAVFHNPIDAFILSSLRTKGLNPNPPATKQELIRRVTYDLTGLPPTPEEVAKFEADKSASAYEKLVERLLASPHYGEKWARQWLDLVRFAETNSYERDNPKPYVYKYRDYVIRSFNTDKPYNQFVKEQLAGDEMPDAPGDAILATGYYRLGIWDDEPANKEQAAYDDMDDLITTTGQAFLGLTLDCARCHDHKLDPIPQKDYYKFLSFFQNINRFKNGGATDEARYYPTMQSKREYEKKSLELDARRKLFNSEITGIEKRLTAKGAQFYNPADLSDVSYRYYERDWKRIPDFENEPVIASGTLNPGWISLRPRQRNEEFSLDFNGNLNVPKEGEYTFRFKAEGGYRLIVHGEKLFESFASDGVADEKKASKHLPAGKVSFNLIFNQRHKQHGIAISWSGPDFTARPLSSLESCGKDGVTTLFGGELPKLFDKDTADHLSDLVNNQAALEKQAPPVDKVLCVTEQGPKAADTFLLLRGVPTAHGEKVEPGFPVCASGSTSLANIEPPLNRKSTGRRTALANWIASPDNPLTARVLVNRIWQNHFGRGIVRTPNDFGLQGAPPTHPELLNWLAKEFVDNGWSIKKLNKLILMSDTYRQSSHGNSAGLAKDPQNDLFWRFDMRRLTAEEIRDSILSVSGNINLEMFGPSVYPEIPKEILAAQSRPGKDWFTERMSPEDVCRRSIYINVKRSLIYPFFACFDLPETDRTSAARFTSTQPTQSLSMINGPLVNKQAVVLANRVREEAGSEPRAFTKRMLSLVLQRTPAETDIAECLKLMARLKSHGAKPEQVQNYICLAALNLNEFFYID